jgi:hypothetical protein
MYFFLHHDLKSVDMSLAHIPIYLVLMLTYLNHVSSHLFLESVLKTNLCFNLDIGAWSTKL